MKLNKRDSIFILIVVVVITFLTVGSKERTTKAVPDNDIHNRVTSRAQCMACHGEKGVKPQPLGHPRANQCFQCHKQPAHWVGNQK
jgi:cytochrome c553